MKYTIAILMFLLFTVTINAQTPATPADTAKLIAPPDSIAIVSLKDYNVFYAWLQENVSKSNYEKLTPDLVLTQFFQWAIVEWNKKNKKKPK